MSEVQIAGCSCVSSYQDGRYGASKRVHNHAPTNEGDQPRFRCTVCGTTRDLGGGVKPKFEEGKKKAA